MVVFLCVALTVLQGCAGKPQQTKFTNFESHAAVTGVCTAAGIYVLRKLDVPSPWNEIGGAAACIAAVTVVKGAGKDPVFDWGDVIANGVGGASVGATFLFMEW